MIEVKVKVRFENITIGSTTDGSTTPVESFNIAGWEFTLDLNGLFNTVFVGGIGAVKYIVDRNGDKWEIDVDNTGLPVKTNTGINTGGPRTFIAMLRGLNVWMIGIDNSGEFEPYDLSI